MTTSFLNSLEWRRAVKNFVPPSAGSPAPAIEPILKAAAAAPSSFGLQPYKILVITDKETKAQLRAVSFDQPQVSECTHLLVFCARNDLEARVDDFVGRTGMTDDQRGMIDGMISSLSHPVHWAKHQAYISLGFALAAAAELRIHSCPMEGFSPDGVAAVLDLPHYLIPTVFMAVGVAGPTPTSYPRFRFPDSDLITHLGSSRSVPVVIPRSKYRHATPIRKRKDKDM